MEFRASRWGGLICWTKIFMPDRITLGAGRITVVKKKFFGLINTTEEIAFSKIASVRVANGIFFSSIIIETTGGATADIYIKTLKKKVAKEVAGLIRQQVA